MNVAEKAVAAIDFDRFRLRTFLAGLGPDDDVEGPIRAGPDVDLEIQVGHVAATGDRAAMRRRP